MLCRSDKLIFLFSYELKTALEKKYCNKKIPFHKKETGLDDIQS